MNVLKKDRAVSLRKRGYSLAEIANAISASKSTAYHWVHNIKLSDGQKTRIKQKEIECGRRGLAKANKINIRRRLLWLRNVKNRTNRFKNIIPKKGDLPKLICGVLYLCEGARYPSSGQMIFGNSDPRIIRTFLELLRSNFAIDEDMLRCRIMHRHDQSGKDLVGYWSRITHIPINQFYKSYGDKRTKGKKTKNLNYKGVCALQYNSTDLQYELQLIGESVFFLKN